MRLVRRETLAFREGRSDKIYEVDLVEVAPDRYAVNFRYGRRGTTLKEGAKTDRPVDLAKAEAVFADLVGSKVKKGYAPEGAAGPVPVATAPKRAARRTQDPAARARVVLARLSDPVDRRGARRWPLERAIWRAGELRLREAAPAIARLAGTGNALRDYSVAWALGRCGDPSATNALVGLLDPAKPDHVRRMAREALRALSDERALAELRADTLASLPPELGEAALAGDPDRFKTALAAYLGTAARERVAVLDTLYLVDDETVRPALLASLRVLLLDAPWFRPLRHVFKAAEFRRDAEVFGILAKRFETEHETFSDRWNTAWMRVVRMRPDGTWINVLKLQTIARDDSEIAYGQRTRTYLRRRVVRTLRRLGELGDPDYVKLAVGVLLQYTDADAEMPRVTTVYDYVASREVSTDWGAYARFVPFNAILYANSPRYEPSRSGRAWKLRRGAKVGHPEPEAREEWFPELWDRMPGGLVHLLAESACDPVHRFATKALRANPEVLDRLDTETLALLLSRPYEVTARLAFEVAARRYDPSAPDLDLVAAVADCAIEKARRAAREWIAASRERFFASAAFVVALATARHADARRFVRDALAATPLAPSVATDAASRLVAYVLALDASAADAAREAGAFLFGPLAEAARAVSLDDVNRLLAHPLAEAQELGARLLVAGDAPAEALPDALLRSLVDARNAGARELGVALVAKLSDASLVAREDLLLWLVGHPHEDVREAARPLVRRLAAADAAWAARFARRLSGMLLEPEAVEGAHAHAVATIAEDLGAPFADYALDDARRLLAAASGAAQELGGRLLSARAEWAAELPTETIVDLAFHEVRAVRAAATALLPRVLDRFGPERGDELYLLVRALDAPWDDERPFWHATFREHFADTYTVGHLVTICDSPRSDARALGRELVAARAGRGEGAEYLAKLSEHPAADMQLFVTDFLEGYAAGSPERLADLAFYFTTVLSRVNAARAAKRRVLDFLAREALKDEAAARVVAAVLSRVSSTVSVETRAAAIRTLVAIGRAYPSIPLPVRVAPVEVRRAV